MISTVSIQNFKGFNNTKLTLKELTIMVGTNNAGKSTLIEALRIASLVTNRLNKPIFVNPPTWLNQNLDRGIIPSIQTLSISSKNLFYLYGPPPAIIDVCLANGIEIKIHVGDNLQIFAQIINKDGQYVTNAKALKNETISIINILPQISPLLEEEELIMEKTIKANLFTRLASRHFRNQIYKYQECLPDFIEMVERSWHGLKVEKPDNNKKFKGDSLYLMVRDGAFTTEVGQMGHGLQMWLQTIWFLSRCKKNSIVILDEPDVYMHADLQRKLIKMITGMFSQVVVATHSIEIISEVDADNILPIDKSLPHQKYATSNLIVQDVINSIGSIHNIDIARLSSAKKVLFTEGPRDDLDMLNIFHSKIFPNSPTSLSVIPHVWVKGWGNWQRVIGGKDAFIQNKIKIKVYCIFDSDYHSEEEKQRRMDEAKAQEISLHIWSKKEIENFLIHPSVIYRLIDQHKRKGVVSAEIVEVQIRKICNDLKNETVIDFANELQKKAKKIDIKSAVSKANEEIRMRNSDLSSIIGGKKIMSKLSDWAKSEYGVSLNKKKIANAFLRQDISPEIVSIITAIEENGAFI